MRGAKSGGKAGVYGAFTIFCMAVLQRTPHTVENKGIADLSKLYPFEKFDRQLSELDTALKEGGLLIVHHAQYQFSDASIAIRYQALTGISIDKSFVPIKFDKNSLRIDGAVQREAIFKKLA